MGAVLVRCSLEAGALLTVAHHLAWRGLAAGAFCLGNWRVEMVSMLRPGRAALRHDLRHALAVDSPHDGHGQVGGRRPGARGRRRQARPPRPAARDHRAVLRHPQLHAVLRAPLAARSGPAAQRLLRRRRAGHRGRRRHGQPVHRRRGDGDLRRAADASPTTPCGRSARPSKSSAASTTCATAGRNWAPRSSASASAFTRARPWSARSAVPAGSTTPPSATRSTRPPGSNRPTRNSRREVLISQATFLAIEPQQREAPRRQMGRQAARGEGEARDVAGVSHRLTRQRFMQLQ